MPHIKQHTQVPFTVDQMFDLVNDVQSYPEFIQGCESVTVIKQNTDELIAQLQVKKAGVCYSLTTHNRLVRPHSMIMSFKEGPFVNFSGQWQFNPVESDHCRVSLTLDFTLKSRLLTLTLNPLIKIASHRMIEAFVKRAQCLYND